MSKISAADLHVVSSSCSSQIFTSGHLRGESDTPGAVDAAGHHGLHQRPEVLVLDGALAGELVVHEARPTGDGNSTFGFLTTKLFTAVINRTP